MIFKKKSIISMALIICICALAFFTGEKINTRDVLSNKSSSKQIILDAGHGGLTNTIN